mgnify:CR=1 FL=1
MASVLASIIIHAWRTQSSTLVEEKGLQWRTTWSGVANLAKLRNIYLCHQSWPRKQLKLFACIEPSASNIAFNLAGLTTMCSLLMMHLMSIPIKMLKGAFQQIQFEATSTTPPNIGPNVVSGPKIDQNPCINVWGSIEMAKDNMSPISRWSMCHIFHFWSPICPLCEPLPYLITTNIIIYSF